MIDTYKTWHFAPLDVQPSKFGMRLNRYSKSCWVGIELCHYVWAWVSRGRGLGCMRQYLAYPMLIKGEINRVSPNENVCKDVYSPLVFWGQGFFFQFLTEVLLSFANISHTGYKCTLIGRLSAWWCNQWWQRVDTLRIHTDGAVAEGRACSDKKFTRGLELRLRFHVLWLHSG